MEKQGEDRTYNQGDPFLTVLNSPTPVIWMMDIDATKISIGIKHTTLSGKNVKIKLLLITKVSLFPIWLSLWEQKNTTLNYEDEHWIRIVLFRPNGCAFFKTAHASVMVLLCNERKITIQRKHRQMVFKVVKYHIILDWIESVCAFLGFDDFLNLVSIWSGMKWQKLITVIGK